MNILRELWRGLSWPVRLAVLVNGLLLLLSPWRSYLTVRPATASQLRKRPDGVRLDDFRTIHLGTGGQTTYRQVVTQLGEGTLLHTSADGRTRTYQWKGGRRWSWLQIEFRDSLAVHKLAFALRH